MVKRMEDKTKKEERFLDRKRKAEDEVDTIFSKVNIEEEVDNDPADCDESDWEEVEEKSQRKVKEYNTMSLRNFACE